MFFKLHFRPVTPPFAGCPVVGFSHPLRFTIGFESSVSHTRVLRKDNLQLPGDEFADSARDARPLDMHSRDLFV